MITKLLDMNRILTALFILGLFAIGALVTARFGSDSVADEAPQQTTGVELPTDFKEAQRQIEADEFNDTKALFTIILGGVVVFTVVGMGGGLAIFCWLLDRLVKESPAGSG